MAGRSDNFFDAIGRLEPVNSSFSRAVDGDTDAVLGNPQGKGATALVGTVLSDPQGLQDQNRLRRRVLLG